jgi:hypothetical protein
LFSDLVPWLILLASTLLLLQEPLRGWLQRYLAKSTSASKHIPEAWAILPIFLAAIYGGYFGAGLSVIVLASLGLTMNDNLTRLNAIKQIISFSANLAAAIFFLFSGQVVWIVVPVMMAGALLGGNLGGRLAGRIQPSILRRLVVIIGYTVALIYFFR